MTRTDSEKRARLLQFVTGTCRVPVGGFAELMGKLQRDKITFSIENNNRLSISFYKYKFIKKIDKKISEKLTD